MTTAFAPAHGRRPDWRQLAPQGPLLGSGAIGSAAIGGGRVEIIQINTSPAHNVLPWLDSALERLNSVGRLEGGWDGEAARATAAEAAAAALRALFEVMGSDTPPPSVVPMYDGGLQLEWHGHDIDVELAVGPDGARHVWISSASGLEIDEDFRYVVEDLRKNLGTLTRG